jgi:hypothetical protein
MTHTRTKKTNKNWYPYEEFGGYFKLEDAVLLQCPMNTDSTRDDSPCEVDWYRGVDKKDEPRLQEIVKELEKKE